MSERITLRLSREIHRLLKNESAKHGVSTSVLVRERLEKSLLESFPKSPSQTLEKVPECKIQREFKSLSTRVLENNLLLRKIARHINSQIVIETDEQLKQLLKKGMS